jgi:predicted DNA-binding mobile mystery protein A
MKRNQFKELEIDQLDKKLKAWKPLTAFTRPPSGWLRAIRTAMDIPAAYVAKRAQISRPRVLQIEKAEQSEAITLRTLRQLAHAMDCELVYAVIPRKPLRQRLEDQIRNVAQSMLARVQHTMSLEDQSLQSKDLKDQLSRLIDTVRASSHRKLWR